MCLAIYKPAGAIIPEKNLENGFLGNDDGAGFAWAKDGILYVKKGIFDLDVMKAQYDEIKEYPCLIHFRKATHGKVDEANCHPFLFNDGKMALIHNGILNIKCSIEGLSDTAHFVKLVLEPLVKTHGIPINNGALNYLINTSIGTDKMAVMENTGKTYIFNENKGNWDEGVWYSNYSFRWAPTTRVVYTSTPNHSHNYQGTAHPYLNNHGRKEGGTGVQTFPHSTPNTNHSHSTANEGWRRHWDATADDDESYIRFWQQTAAEAAGVDGESESDGSPKTAKATLLLNAPREEAEDDTGTTTTATKTELTEGHMCEYGWWEEEIESAVKGYIETLGLSRESALLRVFNERHPN